MAGQDRQLWSDVGKNNGAGRRPDHQDPEHESEVADAVGEKRFLGGLGRSVAFEPVPDEHVGSEADELPKNKKHDEIVREHNAEHGKHEEGKRSEVARLAFVAAHVAERINVNQRANACDEDKHHATQIVQNKTERHDEQSGKFNPVERRSGLFLARKNQTSAHKTGEDSETRQEATEPARASCEQSNQRCGHERREKNEPSGIHC